MSFQESDTVSNNLLPNRYDCREQDEESKDVNVPLASESIQSYEQQRQQERNCAKSLSGEDTSIDKCQLQVAVAECKRPTLAILLISMSRSPTLLSGSLVFMLARVSLPVYTTMPTAEPAAKTVLAQRTLSADNGTTDFWPKSVADVPIVMLPMKVWMSLIGGSAGRCPRVSPTTDFKIASLRD